MREAAERLAAGDPDAADALLADAPLAPPDRAAALAVRAVAAVYRNRTAAGLELARAAVAADPDLGAAQVALSYALQAQGQVEAASDCRGRGGRRRRPTMPTPGRGLRNSSSLSAPTAGTERALERSLALRETALARAIEGFLALASVRLDRAEAAFIAPSPSTAPPPCRGSASAWPRFGAASSPRGAPRSRPRSRSIRAGPACAPGSAACTSRSGRPEKAAAQFAIAEEEDPDDPTPRFFSALERFAANDPIGALADIERAQALGERRGTQRGEAGLAEDRAARGAALGRVYDTLRVRALARVTGAQAVEDDPTSPEAHYFLSDAFLGRQGFEVAQSSEFMLGQILSPPNRALIQQPRLSEGRLALLQATGPTRATFAEFSPLVTGNGVSLGIAGALGTQDTYGLETSVAVLQGPVLAGGRPVLLDDGRVHLPNNFVSHEIYALEGRAQLGPQLSLFTELRYRDSEWGDRVIDFGNEVSPNLRDSLITRQRQGGAALRGGAGAGSGGRRHLVRPRRRR